MKPFKCNENLPGNFDTYWKKHHDRMAGIYVHAAYYHWSKKRRGHHWQNLASITGFGDKQEKICIILTHFENFVKFSKISHKLFVKYFPKQRFALIAANKVHRLWNYRKGSYLALFSHPVAYVTPTEKLESFQIKVFWWQILKIPASFHVMPIYHFRGEGAL